MFGNKSNKITVNGAMLDENEVITAYGIHVVSKGSYTWAIQVIDGIKFGAFPYIGIIKDNQSVLREFIDNGSWETYGYQICGGAGTLYGINKYENDIDCEWRKPNDILEIILDLDEQTLRCIVNGKDYGIVCDQIDKGSYRLALSSAESFRGPSFVFL